MPGERGHVTVAVNHARPRPGVPSRRRRSGASGGPGAGPGRSRLPAAGAPARPARLRASSTPTTARRTSRLASIWSRCDHPPLSPPTPTRSSPGSPTRSPSRIGAIGWGRSSSRSGRRRGPWPATSCPISNTSLAASRGSRSAATTGCSTRRRRSWTHSCRAPNRWQSGWRIGTPGSRSRSIACRASWTGSSSGSGPGRGSCSACPMAGTCGSPSSATSRGRPTTGTTADCARGSTSTPTCRSGPRSYPRGRPRDLPRAPPGTRLEGIGPCRAARRLEASALLINTPECLVSEGLADIGRAFVAPFEETPDLLLELYERAGLPIAADTGAARDAAVRTVAMTEPRRRLPSRGSTRPSCATRTAPHTTRSWRTSNGSAGSHRRPRPSASSSSSTRCGGRTSSSTTRARRCCGDGWTPSGRGQAGTVRAAPSRAAHAGSDRGGDRERGGLAAPRQLTEP